MAFWRQTDQFDWFSVYLRDRGLQLQWRLATFVYTVILGALPLMMLGSPLGPDNPLTTGIAVAAGVCGCGAALLWLLRWPTRRQSLAYNVICSACTAATCLVLSSPYAGLMGCTIFAVIGGFVAYFHVMAHVMGNCALALICTAITASRLVDDTGDISLTVASALTVIALNVGVPFGIHSLVHSLRIDLRNSDRDPLTGLLNRRTVYNAVHEIAVAQQASVGIRLNVTIIDLDQFKKLNDTLGHAAGDEALVDVGAVLRENCGGDAVIGRLGGEEFVIADSDPAADHARTVERVRAGIAETPFHITASLGTCSVIAEPGMAMRHPEFVDRLIRVADAAMYESKRAGGDRVHHVHPDQVAVGGRVSTSAASTRTPGPS
jgi:diguanylate cyclase (GGDEF)-like protein